MILPLDDDTYSNLVEESRNGLIERLYELVDRLSPPDKALLLLYLDRVPAREMGLALGITEAAVNHRIERIKDKLRTLNSEL